MTSSTPDTSLDSRLPQVSRSRAVPSPPTAASPAQIFSPDRCTSPPLSRPCRTMAKLLLRASCPRLPSHPFPSRATQTQRPRLLSESDRSPAAARSAGQLADGPRPRKKKGEVLAAKASHEPRARPCGVTRRRPPVTYAPDHGTPVQRRRPPGRPPRAFAGESVAEQPSSSA